ncbi:MAG: hypothetical protein ACYCS7_00895 [Acidimicrobiales bacterium]
MMADEIPVAHTPPGGYGDETSPRFLDRRTEPLVAGAPDMRGLWQVVDVQWKLGEAPGPIPVAGHVERIKQCGDRVCIPTSGIIHDMRADGTPERGVHDVAAADGRAIAVIRTFEDGVHTLRPDGINDVEITRRLDGEQLVWDYGPMFTARMERVEQAK